MYSMQIYRSKRNKRSFSKNEVARGLKIGGGFKKGGPSEKMMFLWHFFTLEVLCDSSSESKEGKW